MSLVITPSASSAANSRQISAMIDDLPVPTGPATPSRRDLLVPVAVETGSGTEQPLLGNGVDLCPRLDQWCAGGRDFLRCGNVGQLGDEILDVAGHLDDPADSVGRVHRMQLQRGRTGGLHVVVD